LELSDAETDEYVAIILAEELYFRRVSQRNTRAKYYQTKLRRDNGVAPRETEVALTPPISPIMRETSIPPIPSDDNDFNRVQREIHAKFWPNVVPDQKATTHTIASEQQQNEKVFGNTSLDTAAKIELELIRRENTGLVRQEVRPGVFAEVPSVDKMNEVPIKPEEDVI